MKEHLKKFHDSIQNAQDNVAEMESIKQEMKNSQFDSVEDSNAKQNFTLESENKPKTNYNIVDSKEQNDNSRKSATQQEKEEQILQIFKMCQRLAVLYDNDDEVIADVSKIANLHKNDMFKDGNIQAVINTIQEVLNEPDLIFKNHRAKKEKDYIIAKRKLNFEPKSMGDVGVARDKETNYVFHANKKDSSRFDRIKRNAEKLQLIVGASNPHTSRPAELNASNETLLGANAHLSTAETIISQDTSDCQMQGNLDSADSNNESTQTIQKRRK